MKRLRPVDIVCTDDVGHVFELRVKVFGLWWPLARTETRYEAKGNFVTALLQRLRERMNVRDRSGQMFCDGSCGRAPAAPHWHPMGGAEEIPR